MKKVGFEKTNQCMKTHHYMVSVNCPAFAHVGQMLHHAVLYPFASISAAYCSLVNPETPILCYVPLVMHGIIEIISSRYHTVITVHFSGRI